MLKFSKESPIDIGDSLDLTWLVILYSKVSWLLLIRYRKVSSVLQRTEKFKWITELFFTKFTKIAILLSCKNQMIFTISWQLWGKITWLRTRHSSIHHRLKNNSKWHYEIQQVCDLWTNCRRLVDGCITWQHKPIVELSLSQPFMIWFTNHLQWFFQLTGNNLWIIY